MIHLGDCIEVMRTFAPDTFDSIVTDPPYHLKNNNGGTGKNCDNAYSRARAGATRTGFMGKEWDGGDIAFRPETWAEALRVAKPGAYLAAFGGTRTFHRLACAIEDAGWELRDTLMWVYGSGFPKSHNGEWGGTALKPAWEPIVLARKPLAGTVEANWREHGTGGLNIDQCRIKASDGVPKFTHRSESAANTFGDGLSGSNRTGEMDANTGRWPANLLHDGSPEVIALFPDAAGQKHRVGPDHGRKAATNTYENDFGPRTETAPRVEIETSAARFFYCAKASAEDRHDGVDHPGAQFKAGRTMRDAEQVEAEKRGNHHPTVKPTDLMRWLCRLVTPPGGHILDMFVGSGSTGRGAVAEGFEFTGIDREAEYVAIANARIKAMQPGLPLGATA